MTSLPEEEKGRIIEAWWVEDAVQDKEEGFLVEVKIYVRDKAGVLNAITKVFSEKEINIHRINSMQGKQGIATIAMAFEVKSRQELQDITTRLMAIRDVQAVKRSNG